MGLIQIESPQLVRQPDGSVITVMEYAWIEDPANGILLRARASAALATNLAFLNASAAVTAPLNDAQMNALVAQIRTLTKECSGIIRLMLGALDETTGT